MSKENQGLQDSAQGTLKSLSRSQLLVALVFGSLYAPYCRFFHRCSIFFRLKLQEITYFLTATMLHVHVLESLSKSPSRSLLALLQDCRAYSSRSTSDSEAADLNAAREWFRGFNKSTIPEKIGKTEFSRSSGAGGQKVNKYVEQFRTIIIC